MTVPTRIIEKKEFDRLVNEFAPGEGEVIILHKIIPVYYATTREGGLSTRQGPAMSAVFVNTAEPLIYKDETLRRVLIVANAYEDWTYELVRDLHIERNGDFYIIAPNDWQEGDLDYPLEFANYFFPNEDEKLGKVDIDNVLPPDERSSH